MSDRNRPNARSCVLLRYQCPRQFDSNVTLIRAGILSRIPELQCWCGQEIDPGSAGEFGSELRGQAEASCPEVLKRNGGPVHLQQNVRLPDIRAHDEGARAYANACRHRNWWSVENPHSGEAAWAWELGWRIAEFMAQKSSPQRLSGALGTAMMSQAGL